MLPGVGWPESSREPRDSLYLLASPPRILQPPLLFQDSWNQFLSRIQGSRAIGSLRTLIPHPTPASYKVCGSELQAPVKALNFPPEPSHHAALQFLFRSKGPKISSPHSRDPRYLASTLGPRLSEATGFSLRPRVFQVPNSSPGTQDS